MLGGGLPIVVCPHCGTEHQWNTQNAARPFCSERCKLIDLGRWANEEYRVEQADTEQALVEHPHQA